MFGWLKTLLKQRWLVLLILVLMFARFVNFKNFLYFTYDNGRDAQAVQEIVNGNLTLIGPTTGLQGFYLGPLWFYLGVPGYLLSGGNPYGMLCWSILLASLAVPLWWWLSRLLFPRERNWALVTFLLLAVVPGSILATAFVSNPMLLLPLVTATIISFWLAHRSRWWLLLGFFLLGLQLQSEFAYAVFFVPVAFGLIAWISRRFNLLDYILSGLAFGVTLLPQVLFELRHQFLMSRYLWQGLTATATEPLPWWRFFLVRVQQLLWVSNRQLLGNNPGTTMIGLILLGLAVVAGWWIWRQRVKLKSLDEVAFRWRLLTIFAAVPYLGFLLWQGNHGHFFPYYFTPHFILLIPLIVLGLKQLPQLISRWSKRATGWLNASRLILLQAGLLAVIFSFAWAEYSQSVLFVKNEAGLKTIETAVMTALDWRQRDIDYIAAKGETFTSSLLTYTPNYLTAQYDFVTAWKTKQLGWPIPYTQVEPNQEVVYLVMEPDLEAPEKRFGSWYAKITDGRIRVRRQKIGILTFETWMKQPFAGENSFVEYQLPIEQIMGWQ